MKTACLAGASGLIGSSLFTLLLNDPDYEKIVVLSRRPLPIQHDKLFPLVMDFDQLGHFNFPFEVQDIFCCLGTTMGKAGSKDAFREVDFNYPLELARLGKRSGATAFFLVSSVGANKNSLFFYSRIKGQLEEALDELKFPSYHIFRPSLLLGERPEKRFGEEWIKILFSAFKFFIPKRFRAIDGLVVAKAMHMAKDKKGRYVHSSEAILREKFLG